MEYPESYIIADTLARELRTRIADMSVEKVTLIRDEAVLIIDLLDWIIQDMDNQVRRNNDPQLKR